MWTKLFVLTEHNILLYLCSGQLHRFGPKILHLASRPVAAQASAIAGRLSSLLNDHIRMYCVGSTSSLFRRFKNERAAAKQFQAMVKSFYLPVTLPKIG